MEFVEVVEVVVPSIQLPLETVETVVMVMSRSPGGNKY
jgi:hypothetical protein